MHRSAGSTAAVTESSEHMFLMALARYERMLKQTACALGVASVVCVVQDWQLAAMALSLPFCLIWIYCGWLRTEPQLKWINTLFAALYTYGIARALLLG